MRVAITLLLLVASRVAFADVDAKTKAIAKEHEATGTRFYQAKQFDKAAEEYRQAYTLDPEPKYLYATAQSLRLAGDCVKALAAYQDYLLTKPAAADEAKAKTNIERCQQALPDPVTVAPPKIEEIVVLPPPRVERHDHDSASWTGDLGGHVLVLGGLGVAAAGVVFYRNGRSTINSNNTAPTYGEFAAGRSDVDSAKTKQQAGVAAMVAGGVLAVTGIIHYVHHAHGRSRSMTAGVSGRSMFLTGTF